MKKTPLIIFIFLFFLVKSPVFGADDSTKSLDDIERSMKLQKQQERYIELQRRHQIPSPTIGDFKKDLILEDKSTPDRAVVKNLERYKQFLDSQRNKLNLSKALDEWFPEVPKESRMIVELFAIALFISFFGFIFYRRKIKEQEKAKRLQEKIASQEKKERYSSQDFPLYK